MKAHCTNIVGPFDAGDYSFTYAGARPTSIHWKCRCNGVSHAALSATDWNGKVAEGLIRVTLRCNCCHHSFRLGDGALVDARVAA